MAVAKNTPVEEVLKGKEACKKCGKCCAMGSGFVLNHEITSMAKFLGMNDTNFVRKFIEPVEVFHTVKHRLKRKLSREKPYGQCVFYDIKAKECKVHEAKPLYCRLGTCEEHGEEAVQWYYLNFFVNPDDPSSVREWKIYSDGVKVIEGGSAEELVGKDALIKFLNYSEFTLKPPRPELEKTSKE